MGHVNNAVYSTYLEEARIGVLGGLSAFILARMEIDFRAELRAGEEVEIGTRCSRIGTKSYEIEHELRAGDSVVAKDRSVLVAYDYACGESVPVPDELLYARRMTNWLNRLEPGASEALVAMVRKRRMPLIGDGGQKPGKKL